MGKIAKVLPIPKDNYDPDEMYYSLDWVRYDKKVWVCKVDETIGIEPVEGPNWMMLLIDGVDGRDGHDGGGASIDDTKVVDNETWSSSKIRQEIDEKEVTTDSELDTESNNPIANKAVANALADKASSSHKHPQSDVEGLATALSGKANSNHKHAQSDIEGLATALSGKANSSHKHPQSDVEGLTDALAGKAGTGEATTSAKGLMSSEDKAFLNLLRSKLYGQTLVTTSLDGSVLKLTSFEVK